MAPLVDRGLVDLRARVGAASIENLSPQDTAFASTWFHVLGVLLEDLRAKGVLPHVRAVVDERSGMPDPRALEILGRLQMFHSFRDEFPNWRREFLGVDPSSAFNASFAGDQGTPGIALADLLAKAFGASLGGRDPSGRYERFRRALVPRETPR